MLKISLQSEKKFSSSETEMRVLTNTIFQLFFSSIPNHSSGSKNQLTIDYTVRLVFQVNVLCGREQICEVSIGKKHLLLHCLEIHSYSFQWGDSNLTFTIITATTYDNSIRFTNREHNK